MDQRKILAAIITGITIQLALIGCAWHAGLFTPETNCWDRYATEQQAIQNCEQRP